MWRSLADMDGTTNPAKVHGRAVNVTNGNIAHIKIKTADNLLYTLKDPTGVSLGSANAEDNHVTFTNVNIGSLGTYKLYQGLAEITSFEVVDWSGFGEVQSHHIVRMLMDNILPVPTIGDFKLKNMTWRTDIGHPVGEWCKILHNHNDNITYTIPSNSLRKVRVYDYWGYPEGPPTNVYLTFELGGTDSAWPNIGNNVVWLKNLVAGPSPGPVWEYLETYAFVLLQPNTSLNLYPQGTVQHDPPADGYCRKTTDDRTITVTT